MKKLLMLYVIFAFSLAFSQDKAKEIYGYMVNQHFPKDGAGDYIYKKDLSDNDYLVVSGPAIENQPIIMRMEVKNNRAKLYMYIKINGDPKTSLSFSKVKFKVHDDEVSYVIKESGTRENLTYRWFQIDNNMLRLIKHAVDKGCEISYTFEKNSETGVMRKDNLKSIDQIVQIVNVMREV